jgi:HSP20 family protein
MIFMKRIKSRVREQAIAQGEPLLLESENYIGHLAVGSWIPNVDLCESGDAVVVRVELPGVNHTDVSIMIRDGAIRVQGIKSEPGESHQLLCYFCLERRYGKFDRTIPIAWAVDTRRVQAILEKGILTIVLPKVQDRRGLPVEIPIIKR